MPLIYYVCENKHSIKKFFRQAKAAPALVPCLECDRQMRKSLSAPSSGSKISVDNGVQAKSVEIDLSVIEANVGERSTKNYREE